MKMGFYGDTLLHRERTFELVDQPLEQYFDLIGSRPTLGASDENKRAYAARWVIEDGWLFLMSMEAHWSNQTPLTVQDLFPFAGNKVFAAWYNGPVRAFRRDRGLPDLSAPEKVRYPDVTLQVEHGRIANTVLMHRPATRTVDERQPASSQMADVIEIAKFRRPAINAAFEELML